MIITPEQYASASAYDLLGAASRGHIAVDHRLLHRLLDEPASSVAGIARFAAEDREDARIDLEEDLILIARALRSAELVPFLVECVARYDDDIPEILVETVCDAGAHALEPILALYRRIGPAADSEVPFLLASLGVRDDRIEEVLNELGESDPDEAAFCTEIYRDLSRADDEPEQFDIWAEYPFEADPPFEVLEQEERLEFLDANSAGLRAAAARSFAADNELPAAVVDRLRDIARADPAPAVRSEAWRSLALELDDDALRTEIKDRLLDASTPANEQAGLVVALASEAGEPAIRNRVLALFASPQTRVSAAEAMWRSGEKCYIELVKKALDDPNPDVREQAIMGVGYLGLAGELGRLKTMMEDPVLRPASLFAYTLALPADISPGGAKGLFHKVDKVAAGLRPEEADIVHLAINQRLLAAGHDPIFLGDQ